MPPELGGGKLGPTVVVREEVQDLPSILVNDIDSNGSIAVTVPHFV